MHWPELRVVIFVLNNNEKEISSTTGMNFSVQTSFLMNKRITENVSKRVKMY